MIRRLGVLIASVVTLGVSGAVPASADETPLPTTATPTASPKIEVSKTTGVVPGEELVVKGSGFDPAANVSTRVPVTPGQPAGVYVVFGSFADVWQPSTGADASTRTLIDTKWAVPQPSYDQVQTDYPLQKPKMVLLNPDGTFEVKVKTKVVAENPRNYGVYTYPGGGAVNPAHELGVKVTFQGDENNDQPPPEGMLDWGLKASFRSYIEGNIAHGSITMLSPATRNTNGTFRFAEGAGTATQVGFAGGVYFKGHETQPGNPLLEVTVRDIRVALNGSTGKLIADVVSKALDTGQLTTYDDVALADVDFATHPVVVENGVAHVVGAPATLTEAGVPAFAGFYSAGTALDPISFSVKLTSPPTWQPKLQVLGPDGKPLSVVPAAGVTATVRGSGFDPGANLSTRPPVTPGQPAGVYVVFGSFDKTWRPSDGAPAGTRRVLDQKWALPDASRPSQDPAYVTLTPEGTFETTLTVKPADGATGTYGVATYAAGGAAPNAVQELLTPVVFANASTPVLTVEPRTDLSDGQSVTVKGAGYAPNRALYVAQTPQGASGTSNPSPFSGAQRVVTSAAGTFETSVVTSVTFTNEGAAVDCKAVACYVASFSSPLASDNEAVDLRGDRSQDSFQAITFKEVGPQPVLPVVTKQPAAASVVAGSNVEFAAEATGTPEPSVQWERSADEGKTWAPVASESAVTKTLRLDSVQAADSGSRFRAVFSNTAGSATSNAATLTVGAADPKVSVEPGTVRQGGELVVSGTGFPAGQKVTATVDGAAPPGAATYSFSNTHGQTVTVSAADGKALSVAGGKLVIVDGAEVAVKVSGLTNSKENTAAAPSGFYVLTAVDNGPGQQASPAIGGVDMSGETGQSQWITNYPYAGSENIVVSIGSDLVARTTVKVASKDDLTDCSTASNGCVLYLRADHRATANRAFDVRVPLEFKAAGALAAGSPALGEQVADASGKVRFSWTVPSDFAVGKHVVTLGGPEGVTASASFSVAAAGTPTPTPTPTVTPTPTPTPSQSTSTNPTNAPSTSNAADSDAADSDASAKAAGALASTGGAALWLPVGGAVLLLAGLLITLATRRKKKA